jgi:hypothetical protein
VTRADERVSQQRTLSHPRQEADPVSKLKSAALAALAFALFAILAGPAAAHDRNGDRIPDRWEKRHHLSLAVKQGRRDQDGDGLRNRAEWKAGLDPRDEDSDDDGIEDGDENAGTIEKFDATTGKLTIKLFSGDSISGLVTGDTEIECDDDAHSSSSGPGDDGDDDHGDDDRGDDRGDDDQGDDDHGDDGHGETCGSDALTAGREVEEAELKLSNGKATFKKIELD